MAASVQPHLALFQHQQQQQASRASLLGPTTLSCFPSASTPSAAAARHPRIRLRPAGAHWQQQQPPQLPPTFRASHTCASGSHLSSRAIGYPTAAELGARGGLGSAQILGAVALQRSAFGGSHLGLRSRQAFGLPLPLSSPTSPFPMSLPHRWLTAATAQGGSTGPSGSGLSDPLLASGPSGESPTSGGEGSSSGSAAVVDGGVGENGSVGAHAGGGGEGEWPSGEMVFGPSTGFGSQLLMKLKMMVALPWKRVKKGSVLTMKISGQIDEKVGGRFSRTLALPDICSSLIKAAHDPRVSGLYIKIDPIAAGWGKVQEIVRHIEYFKQSGKFTMAYITTGGEKEYFLACACTEIYTPPEGYVSLRGLKVGGTFLKGALDKLGVEAQVQAIGKYKSAGDTFKEYSMTDANREMLTALLDEIFGTFTQSVAAARGKTKEDVVALLDAGVQDMSELKKEGWITDTLYEDELEEKLKALTGGPKDKCLTVDLKKYTRVPEGTLNLGARDAIAVLRTAGSITRGGGGGLGRMSGITSEDVIKKLRYIKENKKRFKAVVLRIDSGGGDALASDLMWRELRQLSKELPIIASMADVAASGGYYMAMGCDAIVAESLTITGSIGVVTLKLNLAELYGRAGVNKVLISRGKYAEVDTEQRPFTEDEADFFQKGAMRFYETFRGKAAASRKMPVEEMEKLAQGRVWAGRAAQERGLVDALGGISTALAIAKQKAGLKQSDRVRLVELARTEMSLGALLGGAAVSALEAVGYASAPSWLLALAKLGEVMEGGGLVGVGQSQGWLSGQPLALMDGILVDGVGGPGVGASGGMGLMEFLGVAACMEGMLPLAKPSNDVVS